MKKKTTKQRIREEVEADRARYDEVTRRLQARMVPQQLRVTEASDFLVQQLIHDRSFG